MGSARDWSQREIWTLLLLAFGGIVVVGWPIGVWLLWTSHAWTRNEKLLGTFVVPGGLGLPYFLFSWGPDCSVVNGVERGCSGVASTLYEITLIAALVLALAGIAFLAFRLWSRSRLTF